MNKTIWIALLGVAVCPMLASADDWKDESGRVRMYYERNWGEPSETPPWARGRGYWEGDYGVTPPGQRPYKLPDGYYRSYNPPPNWRGDRDANYQDRLEERRGSLRDRQRQARENYTERLNELREQQLRATRYGR